MLTKEEMDFVIQLVDRRPRTGPLRKENILGNDMTIIEKDVVDIFLQIYLERDMLSGPTYGEEIK